MHAYAVAEDCLILEAALAVGVHRKHGMHGGISKRTERFLQMHRSLCESRGVVCGRTLGSLRMRLYRLFSAGVMKWGPNEEQARVFAKHKAELDNTGTEAQKTLRDNLLAQIFTLDDGTYCVAKCQTGQNPASHEVFRKRSAKAAARKARLIAKSKNRQKQASHRTVSQESAFTELPNDELDVTPNQRCYAMQQPIATPQELIATPQTDKESDHHEQQVQRTFAPMRDQDFGGPKPDRQDNLSAIHAAYKENLKTFREVSYMQHARLDSVTRFYDEHRIFLKKTLENLAGQQECLLELMKREVESTQTKTC